jgi:hypothetical protein
MPKKIKTLTPISENRRTLGERGNLGKHKICGARGMDLLWVTLALISHVLAPKIPQEICIKLLSNLTNEKSPQK